MQEFAIQSATAKPAPDLLLAPAPISHRQTSVEFQPDNDQRGAGYSTSTAKFERVDQPHRFDEQIPDHRVPQSHVKFDEISESHPTTVNSTPTEEPAALGLDQLRLSSQAAETLIETVSKAIASVLIDKSSLEIEQKIQTRPGSGYQTPAPVAELPKSGMQPDQQVTTPEPASAIEELVSDLELVLGSEPGPPAIESAPAESAPAIIMTSDAEDIAAEISSETAKEIPTSVAAWDVEDFRWPTITNQMIISGGEAIDQLAHSTFELASGTGRRIAIMGLGRGEGTTSIAISLARWIAASGKKVLLVDADIASPDLSDQVGLAPNLTWINAVSQSLSPAEVIVRSQKTNLCVMPMAQMVSRVTWPRFIYDNLGELTHQVQTHFDLVIYDIGPVSQLLAELSRPELLTDAALLVHDGVGSPEFNQTKHRLESFGLDKFIVAQNRVHKKTVNVA